MCLFCGNAVTSCICSSAGGTGKGTGDAGTGRSEASRAGTASLAAVPDDDELFIGGIRLEGRQLCWQAWRDDPPVPVAWVTGRPVRSAGMSWAELSKQALRTGLQPFLLAGLDGTTERPWDSGEIGKPQDTGSIGQVDVTQVLADGWWDVPEEEYAQDDELRAMLGPAGRQFPGLAPASTTELEPELRRRALQQYSPDAARLGLVPANRPADVLPRLGWSGGDRSNSMGMATIAAVLRSWEDRFGARLFEVGFADIRLFVSRPPQTLRAAEAIAAEHFAFSDEAAPDLRKVRAGTCSDLG
jgi:hypothetical protein